MPTICNSRGRDNRDRHRQAGSALLIVLAFVVLLTGLILAFFSRSILEQQVAVGSANQVKVDNFMMAAVATTVSDLKQEIEAGSTVNNPISGNYYVAYYSPTVLSTTTGPNTSKTYPSMIPAVTPAASAAYGYNLASGSLLNLIKVSLHNQKFYSASSPYSGTPTNPNRAAAVSTGLVNTTDPYGTPAGSSLDGTSLNGRYLTGTRWNKPLFAAPNTTFPLPDWIYVTRSGQNPTTSAPALSVLVSSPSNMATATTVVGRYAYAIYDEGGLLDLNVAGAPSTLPASYSAYKNALSMADLSQVLTAAGLSSTQSQQVVDTIVGWRNKASATQSQNFATATAPSGSASTGYTWSAGNATNYWANVITNPTGFLRPVSAWTTAPSSLTQSDQFFTSRQQLISFFNTALTSYLGSSYQTQLQTALQYFTHFSRDLNQPSFQPGYNRPTVLAVASGGNDKGGGTEDNIGTTAASIGTIAKSTVNPSFLSARVGMFSGTSFTRNDGTTANLNDPLVKKRFALNRLAWLTFAGPIADDSGNLNPATFPDGTAIPSSVQTQVGTLITQLETTYGFTPTFLAQGGPSNIKKYFGLAWVLDNSTSIGLKDGTYKWKYEHGTKVSGSGVSGNATTPGPICPLGYVVTAGRDPDFFELLKAAIEVGSIAKAGTTNTGTGGTTTAGQSGPPTSPWGYQAEKDTSVDAYIIQLGANIINQFNPDSYSRRILFDDGTFLSGSTAVPQEYRGVVDLPYLYRLRGTHIKLTDSNLPETLALQGTSTVTGYTLATAGTGTFMEIPEIFDPFTWNTSVTPTLKPTSFQLIPLSADPVNINAGSPKSNGTTQPVPYSRNNGVSQGESPSSPGYPTAFTLNGEAITFTIPASATGASFFREPTLLNKPDPATISGNAATDAGPPRGSAVTSSGSNSTGYSNAPIKSYYQAAAYLAKTTSGGASTPFPTSITGLTDNQQYLGFSFGTVPLWFPKSGTTFDATISVAMTGGFNFSGSGNTYFTYQIQYQDPIDSTKWDTYDEKYLPLSFATPAGGGFGMNQGVNAFLSSSTAGSVAYGSSGSTTITGDPAGDTAHFDLLQGDQYAVVMDPRTARFSTKVFQGGQTTAAYWPPPLSHDTSAWAQWVDASQNAVMSARPDYNVGWNIINPPAGIGFYNQAGTTSTNPDGGGTSALGGLSGVLSQNSINTESFSTASNNLSTVSSQSTGASTTLPQYYADPDGVVRRATAGYSASPASPESTAVTYVVTPTQPAAYNGLPLQTSTMFTSGVASPITYSSRPVMLNRPFRSVADLGYVFSGTPWKNIDLSTPESGYSALLDVFCLNDTDDPNGLVAGKVNLNTRQPLVLKSILSGAYKDEFNPGTTQMSAADAAKLITDATYGLITRTTSTANNMGPLTNMADLVGKWVVSYPTATPIDGSKAYSGFSGDLTNIGTTDTGTPYAYQVQRFREAAIRALANSGQTRVWNLMIDIVAQSGHLPTTAGSLANFYVDGEQRYWVHVAIDRYTGQVIDQQIEVVKE